MSAPRWWKRVLAGLPPVAFGATAAAVVAGPAVPDDVWIRVVGTVVAVVLASLISGRRRVLNHPLVLDALAAVLGVASLVLVGIDAPPLDDVLDADALVEGAVMAAAVALLSVAALLTADLVRSRRDGPIGEGRR